MVKFIESKEVKSRHIEFEANATRYSIIYTWAAPGWVQVTDAAGRWSALVNSYVLLNSRTDIAADVLASEGKQSIVDWTNILTAIRKDAKVKRETELEQFLRHLTEQEFANGDGNVAEALEGLRRNWLEASTLEEIANDVHDIYFDTMDRYKQDGILRGRAQAGGRR